MTTRRRKHWGWGYEDEQPSTDEVRATAGAIVDVLGMGSTDVEEPAPLPELPAPRVAPPPGPLAAVWDTTAHARATHAWGRSYQDVVRGFRGDFAHAPDGVLRPQDEREVELALEWCSSAGVVCVPFGGGTSVVGGVTPRGIDGPVASLDLGALDRVLEVDQVSRAARIQAGVFGPALEAQLSDHGMTLRHFPQSFELSTLGGWIATRAGGHFATVETHIDDLVESVRAVTPSGVWESRRLPGSGAGPSPDRMLLGSEGTLGVITEAWVRVRPRPTFKRSAGVTFDSFMRGAEAVRALSQSGLHPSNCRLIDPVEAGFTGTGDGSAAVLVLGFESADHDVGPWMDRALEIAREHGGEAEEREDVVGTWRGAFLRAPYLRDTFVAIGILSETFETAITWDRFPSFHEQVLGSVREAAGERALVSCRFTHVYPDGPAPYYTVLAPARRGEEVEQWAEIKTAAGDALNAAGGTITHHHAVGRDHRPWYDRQRPDPFAAALRAAKRELDPAGILNPGVLVDP